jgi:hypothetical protein
MDCKDCLALVPSYIDQELSDVQAAPMRQHFMDCPACRKSLSGESSLKRWFVDGPETDADIPPGFAHRVARRAFAGDQGRSDGDDLALGAGAGQTPIYSFVLYATATAAAILLIVSGLLFQVHLGDGDNLHADNPSTLEEILHQADVISDPSSGTGARSDGASALEDMSDHTTRKGNSALLQAESQ